MSGIVNKAKEMVDKAIHPEHKETTTTTGGANHPHSTNAGLGMTGTTGVGHGHGHGHNTGVTGAGAGTGYGGTGTTGTGIGSGAHGSTNAGPHSSNVANTLDPRVDSDMDGSRNAGMSSGYGANTHGGYGSQTTGPHSSNVANAADPRVDSDNSTGAYGGHHGGQHGLTSTTGTGTSGTRTAGVTGGLTGTHGTGPAPNTAGPHKSDMMNKADPRVDSNLDGSKTMGGDKTYTGAFDGSAEPSLPSNSTPDAATHGPSAFRDMASNQNLPTESDHSRRHSLADTKNTLAKYGSGHQ